MTKMNKEVRVHREVSTKQIFIYLLLFVLLSSSLLPAEKSQYGRTEKNEENRLSQDLDKLIHVCEDFFSPFDDLDRKNFRMLKNRVVAVYGEYRKSYKPGHHHAGIDLGGGFNETVYAIGRGRVLRIFRTSPHKTVIIKHYLPDKKFLYSVYTHVKDNKVKVGDWVDEKTALARLFDQDELISAGFGTPNHLHLEIRKSFADRGRASYASMSMYTLNRFCKDPQKFFKTHLK